MIITTKSSAADHETFFQLLQEREPVLGWHLSYLSHGAYMWECEQHEHWKVYCTPFFEGYSRVLITYAPPNNQPPSSGVPKTVPKGNLTIEEFLADVQRMFLIGMSRGRIPKTTEFHNYVQEVIDRRRANGSKN